MTIVSPGSPNWSCSLMAGIVVGMVVGIVVGMVVGIVCAGPLVDGCVAG
ncbi:MAG TPA: hypothetical protein VLJ37_02570 [bacterium]|nr:hypothetical protein [bacterium]